jgi:hypothetical protein
MKRKVVIGSAVILFAVIAVLAVWDAPRNRIELMMERRAIERTAETYLKAEMAQDHRQVYALLAPSSTYKKTHAFEQYVRDVSGSPVVIRSYRIVDIYRLRGNDNKGQYPAVSRFVQVEVDVDVGFTDTGTTGTCNYCFTFLKEGGSWYKG